jgi:hypothetical protein
VVTSGAHVVDPAELVSWASVGAAVAGASVVSLQYDPMLADPAALVSCASVGADVAGTHREFSQSQSSYSWQHKPPATPPQHLVLAGQHDEYPSDGTRARQHELPASQHDATLSSPGPYDPQQYCDALHVVAALYHRQHFLASPLITHCGERPPPPQQSSLSLQYTPCDLSAFQQFASCAPELEDSCGAAGTPVVEQDASPPALATAAHNTSIVTDAVNCIERIVSGVRVLRWKLPNRS